MKTQIAVLALAAAAVAACSPDRGVTGSTGPAALRADRLGASAVGGSGEQAVYTLTNQASGNTVAIFTRAADGRLTAAGTVSTGGTGTGAGLGPPGALALNDEGQFSLVERSLSCGTRPISLTVHGHLVYALNAGVSGKISGFMIDANGAL